MVFTKPGHSSALAKEELEAVEFGTLDQPGWFNRQRLLSPIRNTPPAEAEEPYDARLETQRP